MSNHETLFMGYPLVISNCLPFEMMAMEILSPSHGHGLESGNFPNITRGCVD